MNPLAGDAADRHKLLAPIVNLYTFFPDTFAAPGTVDELVSSGIDAGMQSSGAVARAKDHDVSRPGLITRHGTPRAGLIHRDAGHFQTVLPVGPVDESGTVKALGG